VRLGRDARRDEHGDGKVKRQMCETLEHGEAHRSCERCSTLRETIIKRLSNFRFVRNVISGFGKDPISRVWKSPARFSLALRSSTHHGERRYHVILQVVYFENYANLLPEERERKKSVTFCCVNSFTHQSVYSRGVLKLELHQFQNKRLRITNANNGGRFPIERCLA